MMKKFFGLGLYVLALSLPGSVELFAFSPEAFSVEKMKEAQAQNKVIIVDVAADWCPTCKAQHKDLEKILASDKYKEVVSFGVDYDDKAQVKALSDHIGRAIPRQSTIVFFKGEKMLGFSVAERGDSLKAHLDQAF